MARARRDRTYCLACGQEWGRVVAPRSRWRRRLGEDMTVTAKLTGRASALAILVLSAAGLLASIANPQPRVTLQQLHGQRPREVASLTAAGRVPDETPIDVAIVLRLPNEEARDALVRDLYDPASPQFHQFLTPSEYTGRFAPPGESYQAVLNFA